MLSSSSKPFKTAALAALGLALATAAQAQAPYLVVDASTGQVLLQDEATRPWNPASTTKLMTTYVALRAVKAGRAQFDSPLVASARAASQKPSKIGIRPGQEITLDNALKIMMVKSANDLAVVIAEGIGGSVEGFAEMMNAEARRLGMRESHFVNPHGFHVSGHQSSARDLAILARTLLTEFPEHSEYWNTGAVQLGNRVLNNTNGLLGRYAGAMGMKTGFVCASGFNLVSAAQRGGRTLIVVVLGAGSGGERVLRSAQLLDQGFGTWSGQGQTLESLASSGYGSAPDMRSQICTGRRRGVVLADDSDYGGAILATGASSSGGDAVAAAGSPLSFFSLPAAQPQTSYSIGRSSGGGRFALGPRVGVVPVPVYFGRAPGSTAVALGPGARRPTETAATPAIPASATALAPTGLRTTVPGLEPMGDRPAAQAAIRPGRAQPQPQTPAEQEEGENGAPLQLPGVITSGPKPGAQAAIRPRTAPAAQAKAAESKKVAQAGKAQPAAAKAQPKKEPAKARPKAKPQDDE
jgi:D-alanyl-D-alanine carboxypeptidase